MDESQMQNEKEKNRDRGKREGATQRHEERVRERQREGAQTKEGHFKSILLEGSNSPTEHTHTRKHTVPT